MRREAAVTAARSAALEFGFRGNNLTPKAYRHEAQGCLQPWVWVRMRTFNAEGVESWRSGMPQSLSNVIIHTVFSTKNRVPFLDNSDLRLETHRYIGGVAKALKCQPLIVGGVADHVHLLTTLARTVCVADLVKELKRVSCNWLQHEKGIGEFHWQSGYGVFSVSESQVAKARAYIELQEEHHRHKTFQEELRELLRKHRIEFDEQYLWD